MQKIIPHSLSTYRGSEPISNTILDAVPVTKSRSDVENGIYIRKEVEFHSTTELRENAMEYRGSGDGERGLSLECLGADKMKG